MAMIMRMQAISLVAALGASSGCFWVTTKHEGQQLKKEVAEIDQRLGAKEKSLADQIARLKKTLSDAERQLGAYQKQSANLSADFQQVQRELSKVKGTVATTNHENDQLRRRIEVLKAEHATKVKDLELQINELSKRIEELSKKKVVAETPNDVYRKGKSAYDARDYDTARKWFRTLVVRYPGFKNADSAQYLRAESYYRQKKYADSIPQYQRVFVKYTKSSLADDAFYKAAQAAEKLKRCDEARAYYAELRRKYKRSEWAKKAAQRDKVLRRWRKNRRKCVQ